MENINEHMPLSNDWNKERLGQLKQLMPDLFTNEGELNINELKKVVDPKSVNETERYEFRWFGKSNAKREAFTPTDATLVYDEDKSVNPTLSENLIIEGENLETLKLLSNSYREQVKCIYIDPPYNTGKDFVYSDNFNQDKKEYWEDSETTENGFKIDTNAETDGRFHSNWLNMMYSRLLIARQLLREDGAIFISLDDNEIHHLRKLCDEIFGEENFVENIIWKKRGGAPNDKVIGAIHENILMYAKNLDEVKLFKKPRTKEQLARYKNPDNHPKGRWIADNLMANVKGGRYSSALYFSIKNPNTNEEHYPSSNGNWRYSVATIQSLLNNDAIYWGKDGKGRPKLKRFLCDVSDGVSFSTLWDYLPQNNTATKEIESTFGNVNIFDTPKPIALIKEICSLALDKDDTILDFFAGSGTTGQAITELNQKDGGNRKYILVQLPEATDEKSEAYKAGYKKISDITIERNKRVIEKIIKAKKEATPDLFKKEETEQEQLKGLGFKVFKLQKSNFPRVEFAPDPAKTEEENIELLKKYIKDKEAQLVNAFNRDELITEILIKNGFKLNYTLTKQAEFKKNEILHATDGDKETLICLDVIIADETVEYFKTNIDQKLIVLERALDTTKKWNLKHAMGDKFNSF